MTARPSLIAARSAPGFAERYGPWALIAGASEGLGAAWSRALAARGLNVVLVARRRPPLEALADALRADFGIEVLCIDGDLGERPFISLLLERCSALETGLLVYNAAYAPVGEFAAVPLDNLLRAAAVNVEGPVALARGLTEAMAARGRGGLVLMTSLAGNQGSPYIATYAASKAFNRVLAEGLWYELKGKGVDVLACMAGAVRTPGYAGASEGKDAPGTLDPDQVVAQALRALGRRPVAIPGRVNRVAGFLMTRVLSRRRAIAIMAGNTDSLAAAPQVSEPPPAPGPPPASGGPDRSAPPSTKDVP
jgi:uncharacterized protein